MISCDKDRYEFPFANVDFYLYPNNPEYNGLNFAGNWAYVNGESNQTFGINGILIYHNAIDGYTAYDRACTNAPLNNCEQVYVNEESLNTLSCSCCESEYFILDGSVIQGPSVQALHRYRTYFDGVRLDVFN
jgi:nitrite reductase/ring-hydroxylating ferredoxin subunit